MLRAIKEVLGPDATFDDGPWNRPTVAGDKKAILKAGEQSRKIGEIQKKLQAEEKEKRKIPS